MIIQGFGRLCSSGAPQVELVQHIIISMISIINIITTTTTATTTTTTTTTTIVIIEL